MVRRLDSCGLGFFLGYALGDEGAGGRGGGVSFGSEDGEERRGREGDKGRKTGRDWGDMEVIRTRTRSFAPSGVLSCGA